MKLSLFSRIILGSFVLISGCESSDQIEFKRAEDSYLSKNYSEAVDHYKKTMRKTHDKSLALAAAKSAAITSFQDLKKYEDALLYYKYIVVESPDPQLRLEAQAQIAEIYYSHLADYPKAISEYSRLIDLGPKPEQAIKYRFKLAKSYYYTNQYFQAQIEAEKILKETKLDELSFDATLLLAHISMSTKKTEEAITYYERLLKKFPARAKKEQIALNLGMGYEELKNYDRAIQIYEEAKAYYPTPEFLKMRIQKLKARKSQLPGAQGFKK